MRTNLNRHASAILLTALLTLVSGCGFQLRGLVDIPDHLKTLHLKGDNNSALFQTVKRTLETNGVVLVTRPELAPYQLELLGEKQERRSASLNTRAKAQEYELRTHLNYSIVDRDGVTAVAATDIFTERTYNYDENNVNATTSEEASLRQEMRETLAGQLVRRYLKLVERYDQ